MYTKINTHNVHNKSKVSDAAAMCTQESHSTVHVAQKMYKYLYIQNPINFTSQTA